MSVTVNDLIARWRPLTNTEQQLATTYLTDVENALHVYAHDRGLDLDAMLADPVERSGLYTAVVCDIVRREITANSEEGPAMSQYSQSVNGYNVQGTFLNPGGGLFIKNSELKLLGIPIIKQRSRAIELYDY